MTDKRSLLVRLYIFACITIIVSCSYSLIVTVSQMMWNVPKTFCEQNPKSEHSCQSFGVSFLFTVVVYFISSIIVALIVMCYCPKKWKEVIDLSGASSLAFSLWFLFVWVTRNFGIPSAKELSNTPFANNINFVTIVLGFINFIATIVSGFIEHFLLAFCVIIVGSAGVILFLDEITERLRK